MSSKGTTMAVILYLPWMFLLILPFISCNNLTVAIAIKTTPAIRDPNKHLFETHQQHSENKFQYKKLKLGETDRQPVLFEFLNTIHLTRSKYIITSYISFNQYYEGFSSLENYLNSLIISLSFVLLTVIYLYHLSYLI